MSWIQIKANIAPSLAESMEEGLLAAGASAVTMEDGKDQPILEPDLGTTPLWESTVITGLFSAEDDIEIATNIAKNVFEHLSQSRFPECRVEILENQDWTRKWTEHFKPICFGSRLWICPSWHEIPDQDAINLMLDPGLAFGTGTHPTTSLCLKWLDAESSLTSFNQKSIIDYGCGSGILGIAALLLGASKVTGIDNDPQALIATHDNAQRNNIKEASISTFLPQQQPNEQADIVLANILAKPLYELRDHLTTLTKPNGQIVLSGILEEQANELSKYYTKHYEMNKPQLEDGWARLTGTKKS